MTQGSLYLFLKFQQFKMICIRAKIICISIEFIVNAL